MSMEVIPARPSESMFPVRWSPNGTSYNELIAQQGENRKILIVGLVISAGVDCSFKLYSNDGSDNRTLIAGPFYVTGMTTETIVLPHAIALPANYALEVLPSVDLDTNGTFTVFGTVDY